jgi:hypothetical protein
MCVIYIICTLLNDLSNTVLLSFQLLYSLGDKNHQKKL